MSSQTAAPEQARFGGAFVREGEAISVIIEDAHRCRRFAHAVGEPPPEVGLALGPTDAVLENERPGSSTKRSAIVKRSPPDSCPTSTG